MVKVAAGAITAAVLGVVLRKNTPELALLLALAAGCGWSPWLRTAWGQLWP